MFTLSINAQNANELRNAINDLQAMGFNDLLQNTHPAPVQPAPEPLQPLFPLQPQQAQPQQAQPNFAQPAPQPQFFQQPQQQAFGAAAYGQQQPPFQQQTFGQQPEQQPPGGAVPISTQSYTEDQLAVAATQLVDSGKLAAVQQLIASYGIQALTQLPKEHYGQFATQLRGLGAKI